MVEARELTALQADDAIQQRYDELADKNTEDCLTPEERTELMSLVWANSLFSLLKAAPDPY